MKFRLTSYSMGSAVEQKVVDGSEQTAILAAEKMGAHGLPGTVKEARGKSRVVGIQRLTDAGKVMI
jgi:hypothetical protein